MNQWQTEVKIKKPNFQIPLGSSFYVIGSCFSDHLKNSLSNHLFYVAPSPYGIEYNPVSIGQGLTRILNRQLFQPADIISTSNGFTTWSHHSKKNNSNQELLLQELNHQLNEAFLKIQNADFLVITPGTAYCYYYKQNQLPVNNCHKMPQNLFIRKPCSIEEIVNAIAPNLKKIITLNQKVKFIFTLSPVKHLRDDPTENSYSKALCRCGIEELIKCFSSNSYYFPAYEIMTDELRDYRFYDRSMTHPSEESAEFIISKFYQTFLADKDLDFIKEWTHSLKFLNHRNTSKSINDYLNENIEQKNKILAIKNRFPHLNWAPFSHIF